MIGTVKWLVIALVVIIGLIAALVSFASGEEFGAVIGLAALVGVVIYALVTWVLFGWFQHTLGMLASISEYTSRIR